MKLTLFASLLLTSHIVSAAIAPGYRSLKMMDASIATLAKGGGKTGLASKKPGDVMVTFANMTLNKSTGTQIISVGVDGQICATKIIERQPPKGMAGASSYTADVISCTRYVNVRAPDLMKYEDVRVVLGAAAGKNIINLSFSVVPGRNGLEVKLKN